MNISDCGIPAEEYSHVIQSGVVHGMLSRRYTWSTQVASMSSGTFAWPLTFSIDLKVDDVQDAADNSRSQMLLTNRDM